MFVLLCCCCFVKEIRFLVDTSTEIQREGGKVYIEPYPYVCTSHVSHSSLCSSFFLSLSLISSYPSYI